MVAHLTLVSLMDMFTIILLFLLQAFSVEGEAFTTSEKFKLPLSTAQEEFRPRLTVQVTRSEILVEGMKVMEAGEEAAKGDMLLRPLFEELEREAEKSLFIAGANPEVELSREVVILGDRTIPFALLERVMFTCGQVGYNNISLAVTRDE